MAVKYICYYLMVSTITIGSVKLIEEMTCYSTGMIYLS